MLFGLEIATSLSLLAMTILCIAGGVYIYPTQNHAGTVDVDLLVVGQYSSCGDWERKELMGKLKIDIIQGDITESTCEAIVNAANNHLWMGAGVAGAIKRKGGQVIEDEAVSLGPIEPGEAVATTAGALKAKYVIHAAGMGQDLRTSERLIRESTVASLRVADELKLKSIAFPAVGTGVGVFDPESCAKIMIAAVIAFPAEFLDTVTFVLFDAASTNAFETIREELLNK
jgi:O-acetyl-ADP-ribose deacetylase (regulator of RNase III)